MLVNTCPITQEVHCKCIVETPVGLPVVAIVSDLKGTMRKLFTDHIVWTAFVTKSIIDGSRDTNVLLARLLQNQRDIGDQVKPVIGAQKAEQLTVLLLEHIELAGVVIRASSASIDMGNSMAGFLEKVNALLDNGERIAVFLTSLNPEKLPLSVTSEMFRQHVEFMISMTKARLDGDFKHEQELFDASHNLILALSDALSAALS